MSKLDRIKRADKMEQKTEQEDMLEQKAGEFFKKLLDENPQLREVFAMAAMVFDLVRNLNVDKFKPGPEGQESKQRLSSNQMAELYRKMQEGAGKPDEFSKTMQRKGLEFLGGLVSGREKISLRQQKQNQEEDALKQKNKAEEALGSELAG